MNLLTSAVTGVAISTTYFLLTFVGDLMKVYSFERSNRRILKKILSAPPPSEDLPVVQGSNEPLSTADISDTAVSTTVVQTGVVFSENTAVTSSMTGPQSNLSEAVDDIPETLKLLSMPIRLFSGTWTTTNTADQELWTLNYNTAHLSNDRWKNIFDRYIFYRYRLRVRVEVNGTSFHQGKLMLYYSPGLPSGSQYTSLNNVTSLDHRPLYASYNNVQELLMPWQYHFDFARVDPNSTFVSYISLAVFNQLETGTGGSTDLSYTVWLSMEDVELKVPAPITVGATAAFSTLTVTEEDELPIVQGLFDFSTTNITQKFDNIQGSTLPTNISGDKYDTTANVSGMDNPTNTLNANPIKVRVLDSLSNTTGVATNQRQALNPSKMISPGPEYFDVADDEMDIKYLTSKWSLVEAGARNLPYSTSTLIGAPIYQTKINPGVLGGALNNAATYNGSYRSLLSFLATRFSRWRGSIVFAVEIIATQYQTGKLFLGYSPYYDAVTNSSTGNPDLLTNYGMVVEINKGKNVFEITIPFYCMNEWATVTAAGSNFAGIDTDNMGSFYITAVNKLAIMGSVPNAVRMNVYVKGGDDFEFSYPFGSGTGAAVQGDGVIGQYRKVRGTNTYNDIPTSVRDLIRRPWYWFGSQLQANAGSHVQRLIIPLDSLFSEGLSQAPPAATANRLGGNIGYWGSLFRGYVGDLRLKLLLTRETTVGSDAATAKQASTNYPVWVSHIPGYPSTTATNPSMTDVGKSIDLWLAQRYSQNNTTGAGFGLQNYAQDLSGYGVGVNVNSQFAPAIGCFEEVMVDPQRTLEMEIPYCGIARFGTRGDLDQLNNMSRAHKGGYGFLVIHTWNNNLAPDDLLPFNFCWLDLHAAAGDNFRFGMHTGVPYTYTLNSSTANAIGRYTS